MEVCPPSVLMEQRVYKAKNKRCFRERRAYTETITARRNLTPSEKVGGYDIRDKKTKTQKKSYYKKSSRNSSPKSDTSLSSSASSTDLEETRSGFLFACE
jgi:hypothetical protein